jgi:hypothetical protein
VSLLLRIISRRRVTETRYEWIERCGLWDRGRGSGRYRKRGAVEAGAEEREEERRGEETVDHVDQFELNSENPQQQSALDTTTANHHSITRYHQNTILTLTKFSSDSPY